jgi:hypothetical protein
MVQRRKQPITMQLPDSSVVFIDTLQARPLGGEDLKKFRKHFANSMQSLPDVCKNEHIILVEGKDLSEVTQRSRSQSDRLARKAVLNRSTWQTSILTESEAEKTRKTWVEHLAAASETRDC